MTKGLHNTRRDFFGDEAVKPPKIEIVDNKQWKEGETVLYKKEEWKIKTAGMETLLLESDLDTIVVFVKDKFLQKKR